MTVGRASFVPLVLIVAALVTAPLSLRAINDVMNATGADVSYLPSLGPRQSREPFDPQPIGRLQAANPQWVFIGDSMAGTRIDRQLLGAISEDGSRRVEMLVRMGTGPAWWFLSFKNHLIASGVRPRTTFFVFRDTNMTDTLFRLENRLSRTVDHVARDLEPELDAIVAPRLRGSLWRVDRALNTAYEVDVASAWLHPSIQRWYALWRYPEPEVRVDFERAVENDFNEHFRGDLAADLAAPEEDADFHRDLPTSVLPLIMELSATHELPVCFLRVQRRPINNRPPHQPPALQRYIADFRAWAEFQGACFHDDNGDPEMSLNLYKDGDHVGDKARYTRILRRRLDPLFR